MGYEGVSCGRRIRTSNLPVQSRACCRIAPARMEPARWRPRRPVLWSGYRDSNPGPRRWQRRALPAELQPHGGSGAVTFRVGWVATPCRRATVACIPRQPARGVRRPLPGTRAARGHRTRCSGLEDRRVRRVHQDRLGVVLWCRRPSGGRTQVFRIESPAVYLPQPHGRFVAVIRCGVEKDQRRRQSVGA